MQISELARRAGVTTKAIRYYESLGLLTPARLGNGYRDYADGDVRVVQEIKVLGNLGISVDDTRPFLDCLATGHEHVDDCPASLAGYRDAITSLTRRIEALSTRKAVLVAHLHEAAHRGSSAAPPDPRGAAMTSYDTLPADLPVPEDDGAAAHLPGTAAPQLELPATDGTRVHLDQLGARRTVLYIYPLSGAPGVDLPEGWDNIPGARGCTPEACAFRDHYQELIEAGAARVYGLSSQPSDYQGELVERLHLPFAMLSDPGLALADALQLPTFTAPGHNRLYSRLTMIIEDGVIEQVFYPIFPPNEHAEQVLAWLRAV